MVVEEKKIGSTTIKIDDSCVCSDIKEILKNLTRILSDGYASDLEKKENSDAE